MTFIIILIYKMNNSYGLREIIDKLGYKYAI